MERDGERSWKEGTSRERVRELEREGRWRDAKR